MPVIGVHHVCVLEPVKIERLLREPADEPRLEEGRPHVLEEAFGAAFVHLRGDWGGEGGKLFFCYGTKKLFSYDDIIPL